MSRLNLPPALADLKQRLERVDAAAPVDLNSTPIAAVTVLLYPRVQEIHFVLTTRPDTLRRHAGQVSLPGGKVEPEDSTLWHTAAREMREELGIRTGRIRPIGTLHAVNVAVSGYLVWPFVAWTSTAPSMHPDASEVAQVIEVPLRRLSDPRCVAEEEWPLRGARWLVTFFRFDEVVVWGATARILGDLARRLTTSADPTRPVPGSVLPIHEA